MSTNDGATIISLIFGFAGVVAAIIALFQAYYASKPVLRFVETKNGWEVANVGGGPAVGVILGSKSPSDEWADFEEIGSVASGGSCRIERSAHDANPSLAVLYESLRGVRFSSTLQAGEQSCFAWSTSLEGVVSGAQPPFDLMEARGNLLRCRGSASEVHKSRGKDAPISGRASDLLQTYQLAERVYGAATYAVRDECLRVAVCGSWGTGKTSILNMVKELAGENGNVVVDFNPWKYVGDGNIWLHLANGIYCAAQSAGVDVGAPPRRGKFDAIPDELDYAAQFVREMREGGVWSAWGGKRVIIFVDDLDRVPFSLLGRVLFAVGEVLDVEGVSYVMGFDNEVVERCLSDINSGWGTGVPYIEKVVDVRFDVPRPSGKAWVSYVSKILGGWEVSTEGLALVAESLPRRPRMVKRVASQLRSCVSGVSQSSVSVEDVVLYLAARQDFAAEVSLLRHKHGSSPGLSLYSGKEEPSGLDFLQSIMRDHGRNSVEVERATRLFKELGVSGESRFSRFGKVDRVGRVVDGEVTLVSSDAFGERLKTEGGVGVGGWVAELCDANHVSLSECYRALYDAAVSYRSRVLFGVTGVQDSEDVRGILSHVSDVDSFVDRLIRQAWSCEVRLGWWSDFGSVLAANDQVLFGRLDFDCEWWYYLGVREMVLTLLIDCPADFVEVCGIVDSIRGACGGEVDTESCCAIDNLMWSKVRAWVCPDGMERYHSDRKVILENALVGRLEEGWWVRALGEMCRSITEGGGTKDDRALAALHLARDIVGSVRSDWPGRVKEEMSADVLYLWSKKIKSVHRCVCGLVLFCSSVGFRKALFAELDVIAVNYDRVIGEMCGVLGVGYVDPE